ncbi:MAG: alpha-aminoadipate/glutamate carrier protein LysW/ArgW [Thermoproteota archaeon]|jgi:alpha-aminoadipate carrier protein LysW
MNKAKVITAICPQCEGNIEVPSDAIPGEVVSCPDCGATFEVDAIDGNKVSLKQIETQGEDWGE